MHDYHENLWKSADQVAEYGGIDPGPRPKPTCPLRPTLPDGIAGNQLEQNIRAAHAVYHAALAANPESALAELFGFFAGKFAPGGDWDYKKNYADGTADHELAKWFGNFNFGAVLESLDFSYKFTRSAVGLAQNAICAGGGYCGEGTPFIRYPYGDSIDDARDIKRGYDYEEAKRHGGK